MNSSDLLREKATIYRMSGKSLRWIEKKLNISRSTLSGWLKDIQLSKEQQLVLEKNRYETLKKARQKAVEYHRKKKYERLEKALISAKQTMNNVKYDDKDILEISLAILYLGEGSKRNTETAIGSSDPMILRFFLACLKKLYDFDITKIRCELNLREDQQPDKEIKFWSGALKLPPKCFRGINIDHRTKGKKTYPNYHGVCHLRCGSVEIQRKLMYLSKLYCEKTAEKYLRA